MPLDLGFGNISHKVIFELAGRFEILGTAMGTLLRTDVVFGEYGPWWRLRSKRPRVLAVFLATPVRAGRFGLFRFLVRASRDLWAFLLGEGRFPRHSHLSPEDPRFGVVAAFLGVLLALVNLLEFVLPLLQPTPQLSVFRFQLGDPLLQGAHESRDGGLGFRWDGFPDRFRDCSWRNHTNLYEGAVQRVRPRNGHDCPKSATRERRTA